jgi:hypothetical protein
MMNYCLKLMVPRTSVLNMSNVSIFQTYQLPFLHVLAWHKGHFRDDCVARLASDHYLDLSARFVHAVFDVTHGNVLLQSWAWTS